jgi:hypothetical protein
MVRVFMMMGWVEVKGVRKQKNLGGVHNASKDEDASANSPNGEALTTPIQSGGGRYSTRSFYFSIDKVAQPKNCGGFVFY